MDFDGTIDHYRDMDSGGLDDQTMNLSEGFGDEVSRSQEYHNEETAVGKNECYVCEKRFVSASYLVFFLLFDPPHMTANPLGRQMTGDCLA